VIVDDILDTGRTLLSACEGLGRAGAGDVTVMVTHGLFTGERWQQLFALGTSRMYCTDSVPLPERLAGRVGVLSVVPLLSGYLAGRFPNPAAALRPTSP
jgi:ribose-phosphate pyrophosphokinase